MFRTCRKPLVLSLVTALVLVFTLGVSASPARAERPALLLDRLHVWFDAAAEVVGFVAGTDKAAPQMDPDGTSSVLTATGPDEANQSGEQDAAPQMDPNG